MEEQETIEPEYLNIKKEYIMQINDDNKIKIEINNDEISFIVIIGISYYQYIRKYKSDEIKKELEILEYNNIEQIYDYLIKCEIKIIERDKKIIIGNKEIKLEEKKLTNEEMIKVLIEEIKDIKDKRKKDNEKINELIKLNEDKENKISILEEKINELKSNINIKDDIIKDYENDEGYYNNSIIEDNEEDEEKRKKEIINEEEKNVININKKNNNEKSNIKKIINVKKEEKLENKNQNDLLSKELAILDCLTSNNLSEKINAIIYMHEIICNQFPQNKEYIKINIDKIISTMKKVFHHLFFVKNLDKILKFNKIFFYNFM